MGLGIVWYCNNQYYSILYKLLYKMHHFVK